MREPMYEVSEVQAESAQGGWWIWDCKMGEGRRESETRMLRGRPYLILCRAVLIEATVIARIVSSSFSSESAAGCFTSEGLLAGYIHVRPRS